MVNICYKVRPAIFVYGQPVHLCDAYGVQTVRRTKFYVGEYVVQSGNQIAYAGMMLSAACIVSMAPTVNTATPIQSAIVCMNTGHHEYWRRETSYCNNVRSAPQRPQCETTYVGRGAAEPSPCSRLQEGIFFCVFIYGRHGIVRSNTCHRL